MLKISVHSSSYSFDFDYWKELYISDSHLFEIERAAFIEDYIESNLTDTRRIRGIQFRVDLERKRTKSTLGSCIRIHNLLMTHFHHEFIPTLNKYNF